MSIGNQSHGVGDILIEGFTTWFKNLVPLGIISAALSVPIFLITAYFTSVVVDSAEGIDPATADLGEVGSVLGGALAASFLSALLSVILSAALVVAFMRLYRGESINLPDVLTVVMSRIGALLIWAFLTSLLVVMGFVFFLVPGVILIVIFSLGLPALYAEELGGTEAMTRSFALIGNNWGVTFGVVLLGFLVSVILSTVLGGLLLPGSLGSPDLSESIGRLLAQMLFSALLAPLVPALQTALYFEVKGRNEGFPSFGHGLPSSESA